MKTLPDYVAPGLRILSIGLNPSPNSVRCEYPYATPQNRFWRALNRSDLVSREYPPSIASMERLRDVERIGFTDVVKRPTRGVGDLRAADFRRWAPVTLEKLHRLRPRIAWFQGIQTYRNFVRYAGLGKAGEVAPGPQQPCAGAFTFVSPNPSAANAAYSLDEIVSWMNRLAAFERSLAPGAARPEGTSHSRKA